MIFNLMNQSSLQFKFSLNFLLTTKNGTQTTNCLALFKIFASLITNCNESNINLSLFQEIIDSINPKLIFEIS